MFISQMGQPNFDSKPIPNLCTEFVKFRTEPIPKNLFTFRSEPYRTELWKSIPQTPITDYII